MAIKKSELYSTLWKSCDELHFVILNLIDCSGSGRAIQDTEQG
jgi:hypothetical protein